MATPKTDVKSQTIELSTEAFKTFCEDISGMFSVEMKCSQQKSCDETIKGLSKRFKELVAVNSIKSEGALDGNFQIVFDKEGLFTLAGIIVMLPKQKILASRQHGSLKEAEGVSDAIGEAGNMFVGSWDRIFRENLEGHGHFVQTNTFIGNPWDNPEEKIDMAGDEEFLFVPCEITIGSYPTFNCGVIFPKTIFSDTSVSNANPTAPEDEKSQEKPKDPQDAAEQPVEADQETSGENQTEDEEPVSKEVDKVKSEPKSPTDGTEPATGPVSETIQKMAQSSAGLPGGTSSVSLTMAAKDIMQKKVLWGNADDSVQQALTKMQQADVGYMLVGTDGQLEGIVSTFDIAAALSVYLKPMFAKWRRPIDDATLQIKIKWIMTRPVRTIKPDTSLTATMENMRQFGLRCLPVTDQHGNVAGLVTVFDIFNALLNTDSDLSTAGKTHQAPSLV